jgi:WD40 repeat protein
MGGTIIALYFSPDGSQLAAQTQGAVAMYDTSTGKRAMLKTEFEWPKNELPLVVSIGFTSRNYGVACCTTDGTVRSYDTISGKALSSHKIAIDGMAADAGQKRSWVGGALRGSAIFSPDGATLAALDKDGIVLWDVATGKKVRTLVQPRTEVFGKRMAVSDIHNTFSPTGSLLVSPLGNAINIWDTRSGELRQKIDLGGNVKIVSAAVSRYDNMLAVGDYGGKIRIWRLKPGTGATDGLKQQGGN